MFEKVESLNIDFKIIVDDFYTVSKKDYFCALTQIKNLAKRIDKITYNGQKLSTFEKYILAFHFVANRVYNMDGYSNNQQRNWVGVLTGDKVICSGYASLLKKVCSEIFKPDELVCFDQSSTVYNRKGVELGRHANNLVYINDPKYKICGVFHSDSCWCSPREKVLEKEDDKVAFNYCLIPLIKLLKSTKYNFQFDSTNLIYEYLKANFKHGEVFASDPKLFVEKFLLEKYGFKFIDKLKNEVPNSKFEKLKSQQIKISGNNINNEFRCKIKTYNVNASRLLKTQVPRLLVLQIYSEDNKDTKKFLNNLFSFVQGNKCNLDFIISMAQGEEFKEICKKFEGEDIQATYSFKELLFDVNCAAAKKSNIINQGYYDYLKRLRENENKAFIKKYKAIINPAEINISKFKKPFKILAEYLDVDTSKVDDFINVKLKETENLVNKDFSGIFEPIEKPQLESDLF